MSLYAACSLSSQWKQLEPVKFGTVQRSQRHVAHSPTSKDCNNAMSECNQKSIVRAEAIVRTLFPHLRAKVNVSFSRFHFPGSTKRPKKAPEAGSFFCVGRLLAFYCVDCNAHQKKKNLKQSTIVEPYTPIFVSTVRSESYAGVQLETGFSFASNGPTLRFIGSFVHFVPKCRSSGASYGIFSASFLRPNFY